MQGQRADTVRLAHDIYAHPELAYREKYAAERLSTHLAVSGFAVRVGAFDLRTSFVATVGPGPLHIVLCAEYDALPRSALSDRSRSPGLTRIRVGQEEARRTDHVHACGHNLIAGAAVAAAGALAGIVDEAGLRVTVLGTPAEELPGLPVPGDARCGGKVALLEAGAFDNAHAVMMVHPGPSPYGVFLPSKPFLRQRASFSAGDPDDVRVQEMLDRLEDRLGRELTALGHSPEHLFVTSDTDGLLTADRPGFPCKPGPQRWQEAPATAGGA